MCLSVYVCNRRGIPHELGLPIMMPGEGENQRDSVTRRKAEVYARVLELWVCHLFARIHRSPLPSNAILIYRTYCRYPACLRICLLLRARASWWIN